MDNIKTAFDKEHPTPEPRIETTDAPLVVWGPLTTLNHLDDAIARAQQWLKAKENGATALELQAICRAPAPQHPVLSPSALETPSKPRTPTTIPAPLGDEEPSAPRAPRVSVKLPKQQLKLKL